MRIQVYTHSQIYLYIYINSFVYTFLKKKLWFGLSGTTFRCRSACVVCICMHTLYLCVGMLCVYKYIHILKYIYVRNTSYVDIFEKKNSGWVYRIHFSGTVLFVLHIYIYAHALFMYTYAIHIQVYTYTHIHTYVCTNSLLYILEKKSWFVLSGTSLCYRSACVAYIYVCTHSIYVYTCYAYKIIYIFSYTYIYIYIYEFICIYLGYYPLV